MPTTSPMPTPRGVAAAVRPVPYGRAAGFHNTPQAQRLAETIEDITGTLERLDTAYGGVRGDDRWLDGLDALLTARLHIASLLADYCAGHVPDTDTADGRGHVGGHGA